MIGVNDRVNDTGAEKRFISGIKVDNGIKSDLFNSLTGSQLCSILNEAGLAVIHHHDPRARRQACSIQCNIFIFQIAIKGIAVLCLKFHGIYIPSALFKGIESNIVVRINAFIRIPVANRVHCVVGVLFLLFPTLKENIIFILISACSLGRCLWGIARLIIELHVFDIDHVNTA